MENILQSLSKRMFELWPALFVHMEGPLIFVKGILEFSWSWLILRVISSLIKVERKKKVISHDTVLP